MKQNQDYKNEGLAALKGNWSQAVLATLLYYLAGGVIATPVMVFEIKIIHSGALVNPAVSAGLWKNELIVLAGAIFICLPLLVGLINSFKELMVSRDGAVVSNEFSIGFSNYWHHIWGPLLRAIFTWLWTLLLIIPGIIKALSYAMTAYILVDYPELSANKAIELSMAMMKGHKYDLFYLYLSFIGWILLCLLTLGIGYLWLIPYIQSAQSSFYLDVKEQYLRSKNIISSETSAPAAPAPAPVQSAPATPSESAAPKAENPEDYMPKSE